MLSGGIANQVNRDSDYLLYCRLKFDGNNFIVEASTPSDSRNYICDYQGEHRCITKFEYIFSEFFQVKFVHC